MLTLSDNTFIANLLKMLNVFLFAMFFLCCLVWACVYDLRGLCIFLCSCFLKRRFFSWSSFLLNWNLYLFTVFDCCLSRFHDYGIFCFDFYRYSVLMGYWNSSRIVFWYPAIIFVFTIPAERLWLFSGQVFLRLFSFCYGESTMLQVLYSDMISW